VLAAHLARVLPADRLIIAGGTAGVIDADGRTMAALPVDAIDRMTQSGVAHSGMIAKLLACRGAFTGGVRDVRIVSGRGVDDYASAPGTTLVAAALGETSTVGIRS
jgi:acetylglutamate kinase